MADLSARRLARHLGLTTSAFYHHYGSFERFLYAVSISGLSLMADELTPLARGKTALSRIADYYVRFAVERPTLFHLIMRFEFPWAELRREGAIDEVEGLRAWNLLVAAMRDAGSRAPVEDTRVFHAALHGIAMLTQAGRMNTAALHETDLEVARRAARRLVRLFRRSG